MEKLNINFTIDHDATRKLEGEINYYLGIAQTKGICLNINNFKVQAAEINNKDGDITYVMKAKEDGQYDDTIYVFFKDGELVKINFFTWYYDPENVMMTFSGGMKAFETGKEMSVTAEDGIKSFMYKLSRIEEI